MSRPEEGTEVPGYEFYCQELVADESYTDYTTVDEISEFTFDLSGYTAEDVNSPEFGFLFQAQDILSGAKGDNQVRVRTITLEIEYELEQGFGTLPPGLGTGFLAVESFGPRVVVVGVQGRILTSEDGKGSWVERNSGVSADLYDVTWSGREYVIVGDTGVTLTSIDGITWEIKPRKSQQHLYHTKQGVLLAAVGTNQEELLGEDTDTWKVIAPDNDPYKVPGSD